MMNNINPKFAPRFDKTMSADFERALFIAKVRGWVSRMLHKCNSLLSLHQMRSELATHSQHWLGLQPVALDMIDGSEGRVRDFDRAFFPRSKHAKGRWLNIAAAINDDVPLPPVELVKLGEHYFVSDGHHRISVARMRGQRYIDAIVTEIVATGANPAPSAGPITGRNSEPVWANL